MAENRSNRIGNGSITAERLHESIINAVASVRGAGTAEVRSEMESRGDVVLSSQEALAVYSKVEQDCELGELLTPADFMDRADGTVTQKDRQVGPTSCLIATDGTTIGGLAKTILAKL